MRAFVIRAALTGLALWVVTKCVSGDGVSVEHGWITGAHLQGRAE